MSAAFERSTQDATEAGHLHPKIDRWPRNPLWPSFEIKGVLLERRDAVATVEEIEAECMKKSSGAQLGGERQDARDPDGPRSPRRPRGTPERRYRSRFFFVLCPVSKLPSTRRAGVQWATLPVQLLTDLSSQNCPGPAPSRARPIFAIGTIKICRLSLAVSRAAA